LNFEWQLEQRRSAVRVGWNHAAWGQPRQDLSHDLAPCYERGYTGGQIYRQKQQQDICDQSILVAEPLGAYSVNIAYWRSHPHHQPDGTVWHQWSSVVRRLLLRFL
jgi:hypothetical protein